MTFAERQGKQPASLANVGSQKTYGRRDTRQKSTVKELADAAAGVGMVSRAVSPR